MVTAEKVHQHYPDELEPVMLSTLMAMETIYLAQLQYKLVEGFQVCFCSSRIIYGSDKKSIAFILLRSMDQIVANLRAGILWNPTLLLQLEYGFLQH